MGKKSADKAVETGDTQLLDDVRAFASQLGFAAGGDGDVFSDFAPAKASKKIAKTSEPKPKKAKASEKEKPTPKDAPKPSKSRETTKPKNLPVPAQPAPKSHDQHQQQPSSRPKITGPSLLKRNEPSEWWEAAPVIEIPTLDPPKSSRRRHQPKPPSSQLVTSLSEQGAKLLENEEATFDAEAAKGHRGGDVRWLEQARRGGTTSDKVAAMSVLVQESPIANLRNIDGLLAMAGKRGGARAVVSPAMESLKELFMFLLPPNRKLKFFEQQLGLTIVDTSTKEGQRALLYWSFEDSLKKRYAQFVETLEVASKDNLEFIKDKAVKTVFDLLSNRPEQEQRLLNALVNKLGDPDRKLASKAGYLLTKLLTEHPAMKLVVVKEIETFMFRPNLTSRARYYCIIYLNQMVLSRRESEGGAALASKMIDLYFTLFKLVLDGKLGTAAELAKAANERNQKRAQERATKKGKKHAKKVEEEHGQHSGEIDARLLSAVITGVRRAFPFVEAEDVEPLIEAHADSLFRLIHTRSLGVATQALLLLFQLMSSRNSVSDRFYRALYSVLANPELPASTKAPMFLSLLFKALKADVSNKRPAAFAKRLLQVAQEAPPGFACGCLFLTSELLKVRPALWNAILQPEDKDDDAVEKFVDAAEDFEPPSPVGFGSPLEEAAANGINSHKKSATTKPPKTADDDDDSSSEEEIGMDSSSDEEDESPDDEEEEATNKKKKAVAITNNTDHHKASINNKQPDTMYGWPSSKDAYDMRAREPQYSNADRSCLWELTTLATHVHPSVAAMARTLLAATTVVYNGDPLRDFTLATFLDKFMQRKAKSASTTKGDSFMQPLLTSTTRAAASGSGASVPAGTFAAIAAQDVAPDDLFFYKFYSLQAVQANQAKKAKKKASKHDEDEEILSDGDLDSDGDSDAIDDFLAGEEDGGDEGIGADPDRRQGYDYSDLAAAMGEEDDPSGGDASSSDDEEEAFDDAESDGGDEPLLEGAEFSSDMEDDDDEDKDVEGAEYKSAKSNLSSDESDLLESPGEYSDDDSSGDSLPSFDSDDQLTESDSDDSGTGSGSSDEEGSGSGDSLDDFDSLSDLDDDDSGDGGSSQSDDDSTDEDDDAEVAELMKKLKSKSSNAKKTAAEDDMDIDDINPFQLAEGGSDDDDEDNNNSAGRRKRKAADKQIPSKLKSKQQGKKKKKDGMAVFASADDYEEMIVTDERAEKKRRAELGDEEDVGYKKKQKRGPPPARGSSKRTQRK